MTATHRDALLALAAGAGLLCIAASPGPLAWGLALLFSTAAFGALLAAKPHHPWVSIAKAGFGTLVALGLVVPAFLGSVGAAMAAISSLSGSHSSRLAALATVALALGWLRAAKRWPPSWSDRSFVLAATLFFCGLRLLYVHEVTVRPVSDFANMWNLATAATAPPQLGDLSIIYLQRIVLYFLPLRFLFGPESSSYTVPNVLVTVAMSVAAYVLGRRLFGPRAGRVSLVLSLLAVEPTMAAAIPTHDIPGTALTIAAIGLAMLAGRRWAANRPWAAGGLSLGFGTVAALTEVQRSTGWLVLVCCTAPAAVELLLENRSANRSPRRSLVAASILLVLPLGTYQLGTRTFSSLGLLVPSELMKERREMRFAAGSAVWSDGSWWQYESEYYLRYRHAGVDWPAVTASRLATETARQPLARLGAYVRKADSLFALGTQPYLYLADAKFRGTSPLSAERAGALATANALISLLFLLSMARGLWVVLHTDDRVFALTPAIFVATLSLVLILASETQPRYIFPLYYLGAAYAGRGLSSREDVPKQVPD